MLVDVIFAVFIAQVIIISLLGIGGIQRVIGVAVEHPHDLRRLVTVEGGGVILIGLRHRLKLRDLRFQIVGGEDVGRSVHIRQLGDGEIEIVHIHVVLFVVDAAVVGHLRHVAAPLHDGKLCHIASVHQRPLGLVGGLDDDLLHLAPVAELLHLVGDVDAHLFRELVEQDVPLVPLHQRVAAEDVALADGGVEVADLIENHVGVLHLIVEFRRHVFFNGIEPLGIVVELAGDGLRRLAHQTVRRVRADVARLGKVFKLLDQVVEARFQHALAVLALGHLVEDLG